MESDCPYCHATAPALNEFHREFGPRGLVVVGMYTPKPRPRQTSVEEVRPMTHVEQRPSHGITHRATARLVSPGRRTRRARDRLLPCVPCAWKQAGSSSWCSSSSSSSVPVLRAADAGTSLGPPPPLSSRPSSRCAWTWRGPSRGRRGPRWKLRPRRFGEGASSSGEAKRGRGSVTSCRPWLVLGAENGISCRRMGRVRCPIGAQVISIRFFAPPPFTSLVRLMVAKRE
jgi:hypothetical protein